MNRRKVDLIPVPEWSDPQKSQMVDLLEAVRARLKSNPHCIELSEIFRMSHQIAEECGIRDAKITSDIKHIEIGLTDKSDSVHWVLENVIRPRDIPLSEILILGDEFGVVGGIPGSDTFLQIPEFERVLAVSVGIEPNSVPNNVIHMPGGPAQFVKILETLSGSNTSSLFSQSREVPTSDASWCVEQEGFNPSQEREMETVFTVGNGYMGIRGALDLPIPVSQADLFVAGIYDEKTKRRPYSELEFMTPRRAENPYSELVSFPFPFQLNVIESGTPVKVDAHNTAYFLRTLDLRKAMLFISHRISIQEKVSILLESVRCACMHDPHLLLQDVFLETKGMGSDISLQTDLRLDDLEAQYPHIKLIARKALGMDGEVLLFETRRSKFRVCIATCDWRVVNSFPTEASGITLRLRRMTCIYTSRDFPSDVSIEELEERTIAHLQALKPTDFDQQLKLHQEQWTKLWERADITFGADLSATEAQRFDAYHLVIAAPRDGKSSITARSLSGRGYEGHVFWDTEIFMLPFFLYQFPDVARILLMYRYKTLGGARARAGKMGCKGACFAWESTVDGLDMTPNEIVLKSTQKRVPTFTGTQQIHVTADIAFALWKYWEATNDREFFQEFGAEILIETARFWATRVQLRNRLYHIEKVVGPDEYHHSVNDNAYTNWLAKLNLDKAIWAVKWLKENSPAHYQRLTRTIQLDLSEIRSWAEISKYLVLPQPNEQGIIEQFQGFFELEQVHLDQEERLKAPLSPLFDWQKINGMQVIKQADVLMLLFLLPELFPKQVLEANYQYYEPKTDHGSSLSPAVHGTIAAWIGQTENALKYYRQSVELDLFNLMENTSLGIHVACMGGAWQCLIFGLLGVRLTQEGFQVGPDIEEKLPKSWLPIDLGLSLRGRAYRIQVGYKKARAA
jgi:trehalose/maltose hydrolase-like predicted phosphorylase